MNIQEKTAYLKALLYVTTLDEEIDESELQYFNSLTTIYGLDEQAKLEIQDSVINKKESIESVLSCIKDRNMKLTLIYELLALCYVDNNYSNEEKEGMKAICKMLEIENEKLEELEALMEENVSLQKRIQVALEREN